jgi:preprotein translocase subunit YajC
MDPLTVLLLGLLVLVYLNLLGRRKAQRERAALLTRLVPGAEIMTTSGLHATVVEVNDEGPLVLQIAPGTVVRWEKLAVGRVLTSPADAATAVESVDEPVTEPGVEPGVERPAQEPAVRPNGDGRPGTAPPDRA